MDKTWLQLLNEKTCEKLRERLDYLLGFDAEDMDGHDTNEIHHIYETFDLIKSMKE